MEASSGALDQLATAQMFAQTERDYQQMVSDDYVQIDREIHSALEQADLLVPHQVLCCRSCWLLCMCTMAWLCWLSNAQKGSFPSLPCVTLQFGIQGRRQKVHLPLIQELLTGTEATELE